MPISLKENMKLVLEHKEPEYMPLLGDFDQCYPKGPDFIWEAPAIPGPPVKDYFGQYWSFEPGIKAPNPTPGSHLITDITKWREQITIPDLDKMDWEGYAARDTAKWDRENKMSRITVGYGMWERLFTTMEFTECLMALVEEPEACYDFFGAIADFKIKLYEKIIQYYKPDQVVMHDDYGNSMNMFMSPETWRQLIKPHLARVIKSITDKGVYYEHHCCGYMAPILEEVADLGCASFNTVHVSNNPGELKKKLGHKMAFFGGFDTQFCDRPGTTEEQVRAEIRKTMDIMAPGGSFCPRCAIGNMEKKAWAEDEILKYSVNFYSSPRPELL